MRGPQNVKEVYYIWVACPECDVTVVPKSEHFKNLSFIILRLVKHTSLLELAVS